MDPSDTPVRKSSAAAAFAGAFAILLLDQGTKFWVRQSLALFEPREVIPQFFYLRYVLNDGAAWSILSGARWPLAGISLVALLILLRFRNEILSFGPRRGPWIFALLAGGIAGNLVDRLWTGRVVDFLDFVFGSYHYPTFNIADSAICIGFFLYLLSDLFRKKTKR